MIFHSTNIYRNEDKTIKKVVITTTKQEEILKEISIEIGKEFIVKPNNRQKLKHRDRRGIVQNFSVSEKHGLRVGFKFLDTNRIGKVDIEDLDNIL